MGHIPAYSPEWTDFVESDPGVTLLQLFAFLAESLLYRANLIPEPNYFDGRRLQPSDLASEQCALHGKRRLLWTVCGVSCVALLLVLAARRRAKARSIEPDVKA